MVLNKGHAGLFNIISQYSTLMCCKVEFIYQGFNAGNISCPLPYYGLMSAKVSVAREGRMMEFSRCKLIAWRLC